MQRKYEMHMGYLGSQGTHGSLPVLVLRSVALTEGHEARREVREANSAIGGVHVLPPGTLSTHGVHLQILGGNFNRGGCPCRTTRTREQETTCLRDGMPCPGNRFNRRIELDIGGRERSNRLSTPYHVYLLKAKSLVWCYPAKHKSLSQDKLA